MDIRDLAFLRAVVQAGGYRQAARDLGVAEQTLHRNVTALERRLDMNIFDPGTRTVTPIAEELARRAWPIIEAAFALEQEALDRRGGRVSDSVSVACYPSSVDRFVARVMRNLRDDDSVSVRVHLDRVRDEKRDDYGRGMLDELRAGVCDFAMSPEDLDTSDEFRRERVFPSTIRAFVNSDHRLAGKSQVTLTDLQHEPLLLTPQGHRTRRHIDRLAEDEGRRVVIHTSSSSYQVLLALGREGLGVPLISDDAVNSDTSQYPVLVSKDGAPLDTVICLMWRDADEERRPIKRFLAAALPVARSMWAQVDRSC